LETLTETKFYAENMKELRAHEHHPL